MTVGGELVTQLAEATGARLLPVDSEHAAIHMRQRDASGQIDCDPQG